jgi:hypothetical protein
MEKYTVHKIKILPKNMKIEDIGSNRVVKQPKVKEMIISVKRYGQLRPVILADIKAFEKIVIVDGQHLYQALKTLNYPIQYIMLEIKTVTDYINVMATMNSTGKRWAIKDYINAWGTNKHHIRKLFHYVETAPHVHTDIVISIMANKYGAGSERTSVKNGEYKIVNEKVNAVFLYELNDFIGEFFKYNKSRKTLLAREYISFRMKLKAYDHKLFMKS